MDCFEGGRDDEDTVVIVCVEEVTSLMQLHPQCAP
ncbi:hypothetical protein ES702_02600 [subsurface metagenome]